MRDEALARVGERTRANTLPKTAEEQLSYAAALTLPSPAYHTT